MRRAHKERNFGATRVRRPRGPVLSWLALEPALGVTEGMVCCTNADSARIHWAVSSIPQSLLCPPDNSGPEASTCFTGDGVRVSSAPRRYRSP